MQAISHITRRKAFNGQENVLLSQVQVRCASLALISRPRDVIAQPCLHKSRKAFYRTSINACFMSTPSLFLFPLAPQLSLRSRFSSLNLSQPWDR